MEFGRFGCARTPLAFSLVLFCSLEFKAGAQQSPVPAPVENTVPALPAAQPISQAAAGTVPNNAPAAKQSANDSAPASVSPPAANSPQCTRAAHALLAS